MVAVVWLEQDNTTQLCRVKAQGTTGCSPFKCDKYDVTCQCVLKNIALFHSYLCIIFFASVPFLGTQTLPHTGTDTYIQKKKKEFTLSSSQKQTQKHKYTQTGKYSYSLLHEYTHTDVHTLYSPCGCHQKQPLCPTLCKSNSVLLCFPFHCLLFSWCSLLLSTAVPSSHSMSSHLSDTSPTSRKLSAFADPLR